MTCLFMPVCSPPSSIVTGRTVGGVRHLHEPKSRPSTATNLLWSKAQQNTVAINKACTRPLSVGLAAHVARPTVVGCVKYAEHGITRGAMSLLLHWKDLPRAPRRAGLLDPGRSPRLWQWPLFALPRTKVWVRPRALRMLPRMLSLDLRRRHAHRRLLLAWLLKQVC